MRKNKKEFVYNNTLNLYNIGENRVIFFKFILLSTYSVRIKKHALKLLFLIFTPLRKKTCMLTGRRRGVNKYFKLSRIALRNLIYCGELLGFRKSSW